MKKPMTVIQWKAAVDLLLYELGQTHTLMAQLYNDPSNIEYTKSIPGRMNINRIVMREVKKRLSIR